MLASVPAPTSTSALTALESDLGRTDTPTSDYHDRVRPPAATVAALRPHFSRIGITRLGLITGLDTIGVPTAFATRPASRSLSVFQGKGIDNDAALASAAMEALESRLAEDMPAHLSAMSVEAMEASGLDMIDLARTSRCVPERLIGRDIAWTTGLDLVSGRAVMTPWSLVGVDHRIPFQPGFEQSSDGLASGNTATEAVLHGLCELIERDAWALMQLWPEHRLQQALFNPRSIADSVLHDLLDRIEHSGISILTLDMTSDVGIPAYMAILVPDPDARPGDVKWAEICAGCGCHVSPVRAALRAVTEAAQSRLTVIAGGRDDLQPRLYAKPGEKGERADQILRLVSAPKLDAIPRPEPQKTHLQSTLQDMVATLAGMGIEQVIAVPIDNAGTGVSAVRVIVPGLEIGLEGNNIQIGLRGVRTMLEYAE